MSRAPTVRGSIRALAAGLALPGPADPGSEDPGSAVPVSAVPVSTVAVSTVAVSVAVVSMLGSAGAAAQGTGLDAAAPTLAGPAAAQGAAMLKLLAALGVVLLAFWGSARAFARLGRGRGAGGAGLEVLGSVALGQRERLVVVRAGSARLVLGVTAHAITPVHALDDAGDEDLELGGPGPIGASGRETARTRPAGTFATAGALPSGPDFAARLRAALGRAGA